MCEVTKKNFEDLFPVIEKAIKEATFISLDGEFTGLSTSTSYEPTLFDTPETRYQKLKKSLSQFTISQLGLSAFVPDPAKENSYVVYTFNFYAFPQSFGPIDLTFSCQASAFEFLSKHGFDFNKFVREGVSYMNKDQERLLRSHHKANTIQQKMPSGLLRQIDQLYVNPSLRKIDEFLKTELNNDVMEIDDIPFGLPQFLLLKSIEKLYTNISCSIDEKGKITLMKVLDIDEKISYNHLYERILDNAVGLSRVMKLLSEVKKPIVGHNFLSDMILIYERFFHHLPDTYEKFKRSLHGVFPALFDTKYIAFNIKKDFKNLFEITSLHNIFKELSSSGFHHRVCNPRVHHADICKKYGEVEAFHEAGYDAFVTGFVFLRLAHLIATKEIKLTDERPLEFCEQLYAVKNFENCINIPRATVKYLNFGGADPPVVLPECFIVRLRNGMQISASQVAQDFLPFGSVDVKLRNSFEAIVAVSHRKRARDTVKAFSKSKTYHVTKYDWWKHSKEASKVYWYCGLTSFSLLAVAVLGVIWCRRK